MTIRDIEKIQKLVAHPLEDILGIESGSTEVVRYERHTELVEYPEFDEKDREIEVQYQEVADLALTSFNTISDMIETADTKLVARLTEVQMQSLNTALAAIEKKARLKDGRDKMIARQKLADSKKGGNTINNTVVVMDRNELLRNLQQQIDGDIIEGEVIEGSPSKK